MVATRFTRSERRALRWMGRRGLGLQPTAEAFGVLAARLDARFRAGAAIWPAFVLGLGWWTFATVPDSLDDSSPWGRVARTLVPVVVFAAAMIGFTRWCAHADRRIARELPARVTRTGAVPARVVIGSIAVGACAVAAGLEIAVTVLLATRATAADAVAFGGGAAAVWLVCLLVLRVVLRRPTVAADTTGLALDERLRALDALYALYPAGWSGFALVSPLDLRGVTGSGLIVVLASAGFLASTAMLVSHPAERIRYGLVRTRSRA